VPNPKIAHLSLSPLDGFSALHTVVLHQ